ncbi:MAG: hypothetical protein AABO41_25925 [Acidobacteriota bacterium]
MLRRAVLLTLVLPVLVFSVDTVRGQNLIKFLGPQYSAEIKFSPQYRIPYRDNGFSDPLKRQWKKAKKRGAPQPVINEIKEFPGSTDAIGHWIDEAFDQATASFRTCGGSLARFASLISPSSLSGGVIIEPTIWFEPALQSYLAGGYYPSTRSIRVVNIYYSSAGDYRHARTLLVWEMKNHFATLAGIESEPFSPDWPCRAK